ncbi:MAG TPA: PPA1309 family protein [Actinomycetes bacterium]|jgi:hypothetical protein
MTSRLDRLTLDLERHASAAGWDQPARLYALVETADLVSREPQLAEQLGVVADQPGALTPVDQGDLPEHASLEDLLGGIAWPVEVLGTALSVERLMVPPEVERDMPQAESDALRWLAEHPERQEVRIVVAVLRDGSRSSALRMRAHDEETSVLTGENLVPGLADALAATLSE